MQRKAADGIIFMDGPSFQKFVGGRSRPYSVVVFSNAIHLQDKAPLRLRELRNEFGYLAKSYCSDAGTLGKASSVFSTSAAYHYITPYWIAFAARILESRQTAGTHALRLWYGTCRCSLLRSSMPRVRKCSPGSTLSRCLTSSTSGPHSIQRGPVFFEWLPQTPCRYPP